MPALGVIMSIDAGSAYVLPIGTWPIPIPHGPNWRPFVAGNEGNLTVQLRGP